MEFIEIKNRDAWSAIRGFVYQVDITILRWLELEEDQVLELERGEDIDIVKNDIKQNTVSRELEQIKFRESNLTLNQQTILEILLNFFLHKRNNSAQRILFRFITNSDYGKERPSIFQATGESGIDAWNTIRESKSISEINFLFYGLKKHLLKKISENLNTNNQDWADFHVYIQNDNYLFQFIKDFEWSFKNDNEIQISETIKEKLIEFQLVSSKQVAETIYSRLFLYVFKKLCTNRLKTLDKVELESQFLLPNLNEQDNILLKKIETLLISFNERFDFIEQQVAENTSQITTIMSDVLFIKNSDTVFDYRLQNIAIPPPKTIQNGSKRVVKVSELTKILENCTWLNLYGINGTGKSQLASLIYYKYETALWLDLRAYNQDSEKTTLLIESFLSTYTKCPIAPERNIWVNNVAEALPKNCLIVLNDLPYVDPNSALCILLTSLSEGFSNNGTKLLTTSNYQVPTQVKQLCNKNLFFEYNDLNFTDEEIIEYFSNYGASEFITTYISLISTISHRNPRIVSAMIWYLDTINWGKDTSELLSKVISREFSQEILDDAQLLILKQITDEKSRELLYRLSLLHWEFEFTQINYICNVDEQIQYPNEKLKNLLNIWIQTYGNYYQISPLIYDIGKKNLSENVIKEVHLSIARSIIETENINQISASRCITSFIIGKDYDSAGYTLLTAYQSTKKKKDAIHLDNWGYLDYWGTSDIPIQMNIILRVQLRVEQIRLYRILDRDFSFFLTKLKEYEVEKDLSVSDRVLINFACLSNIDVIELSDFWRHFKFVLDNKNLLEAPFQKAISEFHRILWFPVKNIIQYQDITQWLELISGIEKEFSINFFDNDRAQLALRLIINQNSQKQDKTEIIKSLNYLKLFFDNRKLEILSVMVLKELISIEFQNNTHDNKAESLTINELNNYSLNEAKYLLCENIGHLFGQKNNYEKSYFWLSRAIEFDCESHPDFIDTLIRSAKAISHTNVLTTIELCLKALNLAESKIQYSELNLIKILGELGIAYWMNNEIKESFDVFHNAYTRLFSIKDAEFSDDWINLYVLLGHAVGYISNKAANKPQQKLDDGSEYSKPAIGMLAFTNSDLTSRYESLKEPYIMIQLATLSNAVDDIFRAYTWSQRALDLARKNGDQEIILTLSPSYGEYSLINFKVEETLESYILFSAVVSYINPDSENRHGEMSKLNLVEMFDDKPSQKWDEAEDRIITYAIAPLFMMVLTAQLNDLPNKESYSNDFLTTIYNYIPNSSDGALWESVYKLSKMILSKSINDEDLLMKSTKYSSLNRKGLQAICILGSIYIVENRITQIKQIINVFKYLTRALITKNGVMKIVLIPFVKNICLSIINELFIGSKADLIFFINRIEHIDATSNNCIQILLQPIIEEFEVPLDEEEKKWIYNL